MRSRRSLSTTGLLVLLSATAGAQVFANNEAAIPTVPPFNFSVTESVNFGDVDLDGDWDAIWGDGGELGNDQNRIWINQGGLQGQTLGTFRDDTAERFPTLQDNTRDMEFADIDDDGDLDVYVANSSQIANQPCRWWVNLGGAQGGTLGFYDDETTTRWVGLGGPGSSLAPSQVFPANIGGFIDWSADVIFGDLENDGDLDLIQGSPGGNFSGSVPTRLFLNDGAGFFTEFNPSGHQLTFSTLSPGDPALWAEGVYQPNTTDTTGAEADIALTVLGCDLGDLDGDLDLDLLLGDRDNNPRIFQNRLVETGGLIFRDIAHASFVDADWASGGNYEQDLGDLDGDGDLDLYGLNWSGFVDDASFENDGTGLFASGVQLASSGADDADADFIDYDNDGDLDVFVSNFSNTDRIYENTGSGPGFGLTLVNPSGIPIHNEIQWDADVCDVDGDGDYDVFTSLENGQPNRFLENVTGIPDTTAPYVPRAEDVGPSLAAAAGSVAVRAQVYDNASHYITAFNPTVLEVEVDGCSLPPFPMESSGGQLFRGELPANLVGSVQYRVRSEDEYGNAGLSGSHAYSGTTALAVGGPYGVGAPAGALPAPGLSALSVAYPDSTLYVAGSGLPTGSIGILSLGLGAESPALVLPPFGTFHIASVVFNAVAPVDASGCTVFAFPLGPSVPSGGSLFFQYFGLNTGPGTLLASSPGLEVVIQ